MIECKTYRYYGHFEGDAILYRTKEEEESYRARDPITAMRRTLVAVTLASALLSFPSGRFLQPLWDLVSSLWTTPAQAGCGAPEPGGQAVR